MQCYTPSVWFHNSIRENWFWGLLAFAPGGSGCADTAEPQTPLGRANTDKY